MAAEDDGKSEAPTQRRMEDARADGNVAKSQDMGAAVILFVGVVLLYYLGGWMYDCMTAVLYRAIVEEMPNRLPPDGGEIMSLYVVMVQYVFYPVFPFAILLMLAAVVVDVYQVGLKVTFKPLEPKFTKLNPVNGLKSLFSAKKAVMLLMNIGKLLVVIGVAWPTISANFGDSSVLMKLIPEAGMTYTSDTVWTLALWIALVLLVLAIADYLYQHHKHIDSLKMSKDEVKDEHRNMEGDPKVKQKRFQKMVELARKRMMQEIPNAEVVVRNPTHYAVALKFKPEMQAPEVVAKGKDKIAEKIIEKAREAGIPTWQEPWLARELYKRCEVGDMIPAELFQAVADILAHVMDKEKRAGFRNQASGAA